MSDVNVLLVFFLLDRTFHDLNLLLLSVKMITLGQLVINIDRNSLVIVDLRQVIDEHLLNKFGDLILVAQRSTLLVSSLDVQSHLFDEFRLLFDSKCGD